MENQIQKTENRSIEVYSTKSLTSAILAKDKQEINLILRSHKSENGIINFKSVLSVEDRIPALFKKNPKYVAGLIVAALAMAFEQMNLIRPMNEEQILDLADAIIDSAGEDYLSVEDLMLFLQGLTRGKYGQLYESMDIPKFMEKFELYRQERHEANENIKYEQHVNLKAMGDTERISDNQDREKELTRSAISDYLRDKYKDGNVDEKKDA